MLENSTIAWLLTPLYLAATKHLSLISLSLWRRCMASQAWPEDGSRYVSVAADNGNVCSALLCPHLGLVEYCVTIICICPIERIVLHMSAGV